MISKTNTAPKLHRGSGRPIYVWPNPGRVIDRNRRAVDTSGKRWTIYEPSVVTHLVWDSFDTAEDVQDSMMAFTAHELESHAPTGVGTTFHHLKNLASFLPRIDSAWDLSFPMLEDFLEKLRSEGAAWKFIRVRKWYMWCVKQRIPGFSEDTAKRLARLKIPTNPTGMAVRSRDPEKGPFTEQEFWQIRHAVKTGIGTLQERAGVMMLLELGARPTQLILLEEQDFKVRKGPDAHEFFSLDVPRLKQGTVGRHERKTRRITPELGQVIRDMIEENHRKHSYSDRQMPLLCRRKIRKTSGASRISSRDLIMPRATFQQMIVGYARKAGLTSHRTGKTLLLYPIRFRYTFGTRHAEQGTPAALIAESLDHNGLTSVRAYTASTSKLVARLNLLEKSEEYTTVMGLFIGRVIMPTGEEDPRRLIKGTTPTLRDLGGIGVCGANFLCKLLPPLSCYLCPKFQAWADGPHEKILRELETHAQCLAKNSGNPSDRIPHQLDDVMAAIKALLLKIRCLEQSEGK